MPDNLLQTGGAGGIGVILGAVGSFFGFKHRIKSLENGVVYKDTCKATVKGIEDTLHLQTDLMKEMRDDIKAILKNGK